MIGHERIAALVGRSNATILDIGANDGKDSLALANSFPFGQVFAFEPDPRACRRFRESVDHPRVHLFETVVGRETGRVTFHQSGGAVPATEEMRRQQGWPHDWDLSGSIRAPKRHLEVTPWCTFDKTIEVNAIRLDDWVARHDIRLIDFIWADVQGAEEDVIAGGRQALSQTRYFYTEYSDDELYEGQLALKEIAAMLPDFEIVEIFQNDVLFENTRKDYAIG